MPGFVNAHIHLDIVKYETNEIEIDQISWLRDMIAARRATSDEATRVVVSENLKASLCAGTTTLADISSRGQSWDALVESSVRGTVFYELVGLRRERALQTSEQAFEWLRRVDRKRGAGRVRAALSPHAPYSTAGWLYERAAGAGVGLSTHLAELPEEMELLASRGGRLRGLFEEIGAWDEEWEPLGGRPAEYVRRGALRNVDWLIAHGTYLEPDDFWQLRPQAAPSGQRVAVAYCPRSTAFFGHGPHPFREMLERGAVVCLGTDSLASSPSLSLLDEMRFLHREDATLPGELLLTMATLSGAWALRAEDRIGSLLPGKLADLAVLGLPNRDSADPFDLVLNSDLGVSATMIDGQFVAGV
jgi:cytosine/adenosine deaminase-related metal-dependent hydrolase